MTQAKPMIENSESSSWVEPILADPRELDAAELADVRAAIEASARKDPSVSADAILEELLADECALWALCDFDGDVHGYLVTQMVSYPNSFSAFSIQVATLFEHRISADNMRSIVRYLEEVARTQGMDVLRVVGRKGWTRVLTDYSEVYRVIEKSLAMEVN